MVRLSLLSPNLNIVLSELLKNQKICKLVKHINNPYNQPDIVNTQSELLFKRIFPFPFDPNATTEKGTQIRVYYGNINLKNNVIEQSNIHIDIICSKSEDVWLVKGHGQTRPYEIVSEILTYFNRSIDTLGKLKFHRVVPFYVNSEFDGIRIIAEMMTIGK